MEIEITKEHPITGDEYGFIIDVDARHDSGYWRDSNGDGCPPSSTYDWEFVMALLPDGNVSYEMPDGFDLDDMEDDIWSAIEEADL